MKLLQMGRRPTTGVFVVVCGMVTMPAFAGAQAPTGARTAHVIVVDQKTGPVTAGLTVADFTVKEGGKDVTITSVEPSTSRLQVALMVQEGLVGVGSVRQALGAFIDQIIAKSDIALITVGIRNQTVVDYTGDRNALIAGINGFSTNPTPQADNVLEGVSEVARSLTAKKTPRPAIVLIAIDTLRQASMDATQVLNQLRQSGATMYAATLSAPGGAVSAGMMQEASGTSQVLGDGPRQSGGRRQEANATTALPRILEQFALELAAQHTVTYTLPSGSKPSERVEVQTKRRGVTLLAPRRIPN